MPIIASAVKRVRQQSRRRSHNLQVKRAVHQDVRQFSDALTAGNTKATATALAAAISEIDRAVKKGVLHRNTAGRQKSRLQKQANAIIPKSTTSKAATKSATSAATATTAKPTRRSPAAAKPKAKAAAKA